MRARTSSTSRVATALLGGASLGAVLLAGVSTSGQGETDPRELFASSDQCQSCHNELGMEDGEDLSIGLAWRATMMAQSAVDPYWRAGVRREIGDHPAAGAAIQDECSKCHKPMQRYVNRELGRKGRVFPAPGAERDPATAADGPLALDGASCTICHQILPDNLGSEESFVGGFEVDRAAPAGRRTIDAPYEIAKATKRVMRSATGFEPGEADHLQSPELCATCHTLYTESLDDEGNPIGRFPEQVPYLEWRHSDYAEGRAGERTCQQCHMATAERDNPISSVIGKPREHFSQHSFRGGNFFVLQLIGDNRGEVGARADSRELALGGQRTREHLESAAAELEIDPSRTGLEGGRLRVEVAVRNLAGHKLPTAYPSRRAWIELRVEDENGDELFSSGALRPDGSIAGNDNDQDAARFEPHYDEITGADQVQIYEPIMGRPDGAVTTGLLQATRYLKDNRLLPLGFDKASAAGDVAVHGAAREDDSFAAGGDRLAYAIDVEPEAGPLRVTARLYYQPIGHRWARNLAEVDAEETRAFGEMYERSAGRDTALCLAADTALVEPRKPSPSDTPSQETDIRAEEEQ
ncbi:MAG: hypothetical protein R6V85_09485 [Polyangia bacterium]